MSSSFAQMLDKHGKYDRTSRHKIASMATQWIPSEIGACVHAIQDVPLPHQENRSSMSLKTAELLLCNACLPPRPSDDLTQCRECWAFYCQHRSCQCPAVAINRLKERLWQAESEVQQLNLVEKRTLLTEWQKGRRKMLLGKAKSLRGELADT
jgi:hypothetical protein